MEWIFPTKIFERKGPGKLNEMEASQNIEKQILLAVVSPFRVGLSDKYIFNCFLPLKKLHSTLEYLQNYI